MIAPATGRPEEAHQPIKLVEHVQQQLHLVCRVVEVHKHKLTQEVLSDLYVTPVRQSGWQRQCGGQFRGGRHHAQC